MKPGPRCLVETRPVRKHGDIGLVLVERAWWPWTKALPVGHDWVTPASIGDAVDCGVSRKPPSSRSADADRHRPRFGVSSRSGLLGGGGVSMNALCARAGGARPLGGLGSCRMSSWWTRIEHNGGDEVAAAYPRVYW